MATPIGHSLLGLAVAVGGSPGRARAGGAEVWRWYLFAIVAANLPDIDFLAGVLVGDINRFHQQATHSLVAAGLFGIVLAVWPGTQGADKVRAVAVGVTAYLSHLLLDSLTRDPDASFGILLLWPFSDRPVAAASRIFPPVLHGDPGQSLFVALQHAFSWHNLWVVLIEVAVLGPLALGIWFVRRGQRT